MVSGAVSAGGSEHVLPGVKLDPMSNAEVLFRAWQTRQGGVAGRVGSLGR